jgi:hypothetical protein
MADENYKAALDAAMRELEALTAQRVELDRRIAQLSQAAGSLMRLCGYDVTVPLGLTDACRMILRGVGHPLTVAEIKAQLGAMGVDLARYENDLAVIHTTLKRLVQSGEIRFVPRTFGKPTYQWASERPPALVGDAAKALAHAGRTTPATGRKGKGTEEA